MRRNSAELSAAGPPRPWRRRFAALAVGMLATVMTAMPAGVATATETVDTAGAAAVVTVPITQLVQEQNQWCWAASGLTIARALGKGQSTSQNTFCNYGRGLTPTGRCPNQPGYLQWVQKAFQKLGISPGTVSSPPAFATVQAEINAKRPIETGIYWTAGGGHAQVIYGYDASTSYVYYGDPWPSSPRLSSMSYNSYRSNGQFRWGEALYGAGK